MRAFKVACAILALSTTSLAQEPVATVSVELHGPLTKLELSAGRSPTHVNIELSEGESRHLVVPLLVFATPGASAIESDAGPECMIVSGELKPPSPWQSLPRGLQSRSLPAIADDSEHLRPRAMHLAALIAAALVVLGLRKQPALAALAGAVAAVVIWWLPSAASSRAEFTVLEGDVASGRWLEVRAGRDRLELPASSECWIRTLPRSSNFELKVSEPQGGLRWEACAADARLFAFHEAELGTRLTLDQNLLEDFDEVWLRNSQGHWTAMGAWKMNEPVPHWPRSPQLSVPGWLASALPQGVDVLIAVARSGKETRWVRLVGA